MTPTLTLLDACAVINLYATGQMGRVLATLPGPVAIVDVVAGESQCIRRGGSGDDADEREPVEVEQFLSAGLLAVLTSDDEDELLTYLDFTLVVDDGEAMTAALAVHRHAVVVTDDRKAIRLLEANGVRVESTLAVLKAFCDAVAAQDDLVRLMLHNLRVRGRYEPRRDHLFRPWWDAVLNG